MPKSQPAKADSKETPSKAKLPDAKVPLNAPASAPTSKAKASTPVSKLAPSKPSASKPSAAKAAKTAALSKGENPGKSSDKQASAKPASAPSTPSPAITPMSARGLAEKIGRHKVVPKPELIPDHTPAIQGKPGVMTPWLELQKQKILELHDSILDSMNGVAKDTLRSRAEGSEASAFGMHQADAGSDAYDRDFALSLLSQEQDALYEIEQALKRIELGTYGICEMSGKEIAKARLEAMPFARYTVECQAEIERQGKLHKSRTPVTSLFGLTDEEGQESEEEDQAPDTKD
ncbi:MAG: ral stress protein [Verrucomicrobiota bacterium]